MDQRKLHLLNTSFLNQTSITRSFIRQPSIANFCSPKQIGINHFNPSFECTNSHLSPNPGCLSTHQELYIPVTMGTLKQIKSDQKIQDRLITKPKRMTLPTQMLKTQMNHEHHQATISPQTKQITLIKFTYNSSPPTAQHNVSHSNISQSSVFLKPSKQITTRVNSIKILKQAKNKLCSSQFNFYYSPLEETRRKSQELTSLLKQLKKQSDMLISRTFVNNLSKQSHVTSDQTSTSNITDAKRSEIVLDSSRRVTQQRNASSRRNLGPDLWAANLIDQIPSSKQLGKTIMIPSTSYDFGGLMTSTKTIGTNHNIQKLQDNQMTRDWDQLKGLLNQEGDLKQSIHCGPDVRTNNFSCAILQRFGREIKESTLSYQE